MRAFFGLSVAVVFAFPLVAEMPSLQSLANRRYVLREGILGPGPDMWLARGGSGIWEWTPETGAFRRLRPLATHAFSPWSAAGLVGLEDRIVVQAHSFLEFDAATNRLLRRYDALPPATPALWGFKGTVVTEQSARTAGIAPGYYGIPFCHPYSSGFRSCDSGPGLHGAFLGLYQRALDAASPEVLPLRDGPYISFDRTRHRFWFVRNRPVDGRLMADLGYFPIVSGTLGDEVVVESRDLGPAGAEGPIFYDRPSDSLLVRHRGSSEPWLSRRPADLSRGPETIAAGWRDSPTAFATLSGETPERYEQIVPAIGNGPGANGTSWRSDVWFFNPSDRAVTFSARRVSAPDAVIELNLAPKASFELVDALATLGGGPVSDGGDGVNTDALVVESPYRWGEQLTVYSRTYTTAPGVTGTYGQSVPAVPSRYGYSNHGSTLADAGQTASQFVLDRREAGQFRHNVGVVNDDAKPLEVLLSLPDGVTRTVVVPAHSVANVNLEALLAPAEAPYALVEIAASRPAPVWLAMIDNRTGDSTFVPFSTFGLEGALDATLAIPQIASTDGAHGTRWRSDFYGELLEPALEFRGETALMPVAFYPADPARCGGRAAVRENVIVTSHPLIDDIVSRLAPCDQNGTIGAIEMPLASWMTGFTRTYTTRADGGTLGDILPLYPIGGWPVQHFSGVSIREGFRINVGLYNGLDYAVVHRLLLYDANGREVARRELALDARRSMQAPLSHFVGDLPAGLYGLSVIPLDAPDRPGRSWAYVSIIDNATGDPTNLW